MKRVVLVRPSGPRNAGLVVRAAGNFGPAEIVFAAPERPSLLVHPDFEQMAHGAKDLVGAIRTAPDLGLALTGATHSVGFTARVRDSRQLALWSERAGELAERANDPEEVVALVFGNEVSGLTGEECDQCRELVRLPTEAAHTSINLAMSVGLVLFALFQGPAPKTRSTRAAPIAHEARAYLKAHLQDVLGGAAKSAPARRDILASIERVFSRAELETRDARAWHLLARALGNEKSPADYGITGTGTPGNAELHAAEGRARLEPGGPAG